MTKGTKLENFFTNHFNVHGIIDSRLQAFCRFVIAALTAANVGGIFTTELNNLIAAYNVYFGDAKEKILTQTLKVASTSTLNAEVKLFTNAVRSKHHLIASIFSEKTEEYKEFFPHGLSGFSQISRGNILQVVNAFAVAALKHKAPLGGDNFANLFIGFETRITTALAAQTNKKVAAKSVTKDMITMRAPVEDALMVVMFTIGKAFWPDKNKCNSFFDFSLLFSDHRSTGNTTKGTLTPLATTNCLKKLIAPNNIFVLKAGKHPVKYFLSATKDGPAIGNMILVLPNVDYIAPLAEFNAPGGLYLNVKNTTDSKTTWVVRVEG